MSINITPNTNNSYVNYANYARTPIAFRANNYTSQTKPMSTETKWLIGGGIIAGTAALVIGAKKGLFGTNIKNKINELFKKFGGDAKTKAAEQEAKLKAEQEAKAKAEKEAQQRTASSQNNKPNNNTSSATTSSSSSSSGSSNSGGSSSTRRRSGRRSSGGGHSDSSRSTRYSTGSSNNISSTSTPAKPNGNGQTSQPKPQTGTAKPNTNPQPTAQPKPQPAKPEPKPKTPTTQPKPEPAVTQPKPKVTQPPKEVLNEINEWNAAYAEALKDQPISFIKTFENGEIVTTASVKTEQYIEKILSEAPENMPETLKQELKAAFEQELEKLKLVRTGKVDDEKMLEEFSSKAGDFFENIDNNPALSGIKKKFEQWEKRRIDIAQAVHTAPITSKFSNKSAKESAEVFIEAISNENRNARRMIQNTYNEAMAGRLEHFTKEDAKKYMMQKIEQYVQKCGTFRKVNKNVEINGERVNIIYEGIDIDITSEGKLLKKVFVSRPQKASEMQYEDLSKRLADQVEADAEYASRQAQRQTQRQKQTQQQRRMLNA